MTHITLISAELTGKLSIIKKFKLKFPVYVFHPSKRGGVEFAPVTTITRNVSF